MQKTEKLRTISISQKMFEKFMYAKLKESWVQKMDLKVEEFMLFIIRIISRT